MARISLRDWIEILLVPRDPAARREAIAALSEVKAPLVCEALALAHELEADGPLAGEIERAFEDLAAALGPKAAALESDLHVAAFRTPTSPYRPLGLVAAGSDTRTYLAVQRAMRRIVALKVPAGLTATAPGPRARLLADARHLGRVLHPHVAAVLDAGEVGGRAFVASEMVDGVSLRQMVDASGGLAWRSAVRLAREAAQGLAATHRIGVTHGRVLLTTLFVDRDDRLKLTDFAPAPGTPDFARDLRDLGLVLCELLTGKLLPRPHQGPAPELPETVPGPVARLARGLAGGGDSAPAANATALAAALEEVIAAAAPESPVAPIARALPRRVLLVDDEATTLSVGKLLIAPFGYTVDTAFSPEDALKMIERQAYDAVVTDLNFPGVLSGTDLVTALSASRSDLAVVAMSASQDTDTWEEVLKCGVAGIVAKPLDSTELMAVLDRAVTRRKPELLLVDASQLARRVFKRFFENRGYKVPVVSSVRAALAQLAVSVPDVIVTDLELEDGTGLDILEYVQAHAKGVRVIVMSAEPAADMVIRAHRLNVFDIVDKKEDPRHLLRSVERVVTTAAS